MEQKRFHSHAEMSDMLRNAGVPEKRIKEVLRDLPDPIDSERYQNHFFKYGVTRGQLMDRMGGGP